MINLLAAQHLAKLLINFNMINDFAELIFGPLPQIDWSMAALSG